MTTVTRFGRILTSLLLAAGVLAACGGDDEAGPATLQWYVFDEPSGSFEAAAQACTEAADGEYQLDITVLPADADQQREQLARRLAANDSDIDIIGMDTIWTAEFAEAGWILPWEGEQADEVTEGRLQGPVDSATYRDTLWAAPFTGTAQLLWYRTDRIEEAPATWAEMIEQAEAIGPDGTIQAQGERYEGLVVFFASLVASAGGTILNDDGTEVTLPEEPTLRALEVMRDLARSSASDPSLSTSREDQGRLAYENGGSSFMVNYTFVWPSMQENAPDIADNTGWARWPSVIEGEPSRITTGGINLGVGAFGEHTDLAYEAISCITQAENQVPAAVDGGLLPTTEALYDDPAVQEAFPFADVLRATLEDAVQRPQTPYYADVSLAISRTLHPLEDIDPEADLAELRERIADALEGRGLL